MQKITIIGWSSGFWEWLAKFINKSFSKKVEITITWRNIETLEKVSKNINCKYSTNNIDSVKDADITIFAVPIWNTAEIIKRVAPHLKERSVVLDVTSIKKAPSEAMKKYSPKSVLVIPTHPMFWPYISTIAWQIFVLTADQSNRNDKRYIFLKNFLEKSDAKVIETSSIEHDKMMAVVQWLTHFDMFVLWETLRKLELNIEKSMNFISPIYKIMISSVARYLNQNPKLYSDIQIHNQEVLEVHKVFMETTNTFNNYVKNKDEVNFIKTVNKSSEYFWKQAEIWQKYTDKIIYMLWKQVEKAHKKIWKIISIQNIYNEEKIEWILEKIVDNNLYIKWSKYDIDTWEIN